MRHGMASQLTTVVGSNRLAAASSTVGVAGVAATQISARNRSSQRIGRAFDTPGFARIGRLFRVQSISLQDRVAELFALDELVIAPAFVLGPELFRLFLQGDLEHQVGQWGRIPKVSAINCFLSGIGTPQM